jgi:hypothetical protein
MPQIKLEVQGDEKLLGTAKTTNRKFLEDSLLLCALPVLAHSPRQGRLNPNALMRKKESK